MYLHITIFVGILRSCRVCHPYTIHVWDVWGRHIRVTRGRKTTSNKKLQRYAQSGAFTQQSCYWGYAILIQNNLLPRSVVYNINLYISCWVSPCIDLVLEIPNDAYTTLSPNLIGCSTLSQEYCKLISWYWNIMRRQLWTLTCPIGKPLSRSCHCYHYFQLVLTEVWVYGSLKRLAGKHLNGPAECKFHLQFTCGITKYYHQVRMVQSTVVAYQLLSSFEGLTSMSLL